jgi:hypothetical protein
VQHPHLPHRLLLVLLVLLVLALPPHFLPPLLLLPLLLPLLLRPHWPQPTQLQTLPYTYVVACDVIPWWGEVETGVSRLIRTPKQRGSAV